MIPTIYNMDVMTFLEGCEKYKVMFADPPDNLGLDYDEFRDTLPLGVYYAWMEAWILRAMLKCSILVISYYYAHDLRISRMISNILETRHSSWMWQKIIWRFTFGQYMNDRIPNGYRPILILSAPSSILHYDKIRIASERMLLGDQRAAGLRIPDDVWEYPRIVENSKERKVWHPTQHPEDLMQRIILLCGHPFVDLFGGTGTSMRVGRKLGYNISCVEQSSRYCELISTENGISVVRSL